MPHVQTLLDWSPKTVKWTWAGVWQDIMWEPAKEMLGEGNEQTKGEEVGFES